MSSLRQVESGAAADLGAFVDARHIPSHITCRPHEDEYADLSGHEPLPDLALRVARQRYGNDEIGHEEYFATMDRCLRELASRGEEPARRGSVPRPTRCLDLDWAGELVGERRPRLMARL